MEEYFVYILTNGNNTVLYVGITNNLQKRIEEHSSGRGSAFTKKYNVSKLVYYEIYTDPENAIKREKQLKAGSRKKKDCLINDSNPEWKDISRM